MTVERTRVAIVGGGPAGLLLSHLLHLDAVVHVVLETRIRTEIENTHRAGILEAGSVSVLAEAGLDRVLRAGDRHDGVVLRFAGENHRMDFADLIGRAVWSYPQTEIVKDLASRREVDGGDVRYSATVTNVMGVHTERPTVNWTGVDGRSSELRCDVLVSADGSHSTLRHSLPESVRRTYVHEYPYAWFGVIVEAPRSAPELVYTASVHGFSLVSQRTPTHRRLYFQCDPDEDPTSWDDERIWRTQHLSAWMSRMLHSYPGESGFEAQRRVAEVRMLAVSEAGRRFLAEGYTGWARSFRERAL